jgi:hypothetical protein
MGTKIEDIALASETAVGEVIAYIEEILGDEYKFKGIHIQVLKKDGRMMNLALDDERMKDILFVLSKQIISLASDLLQEDLLKIKAACPEPERGPPPTPRLAINAQMLNVLEKKIMAKMEERVTAAIAQIQMSQGPKYIDPKDYDKHLFGR